MATLVGEPDPHRSVSVEAKALEALRYQCFDYIVNLQFDQARPLAEQLIYDATKAGLARFAGVGYMYLGLVEIEVGNYDPASFAFQEAIRLATELGDLDLIYRIQTNLAYAQIVFERFEDAISTLRQSLRHFEHSQVAVNNKTPLYYLAACRVQLAFRSALRNENDEELITLARHDLDVASAECAGCSHHSTLVSILHSVLTGIICGPQFGLAELESIRPFVNQDVIAQRINFAAARSQLLELDENWTEVERSCLEIIQIMNETRWTAWRTTVDRRYARSMAMQGKYEHAYKLLVSQFDELETSETEGRNRMAGLRRSVQASDFEQEVLRLRNQVLLERNRILEQEARFDPLSGLLNRRGTEEALWQCTKRPFTKHFIIAMVDIDNFKTINDAHGHGIGDCVIREFSNCLSESQTLPSKIGRWGGEEFLIVYEGYGLAEMERLASTLVGEVRTADWSKILPNLNVTASIGFAFWQVGSSLDDAIQTADQQMYEVKQNGRNGWRIAA